MGKFTRREFLEWAAGGGTAMAVGLGVKRPDDLIPYVAPPEKIIPGTVTFFATTCRECPAGCGMHLWHRDGRVTKAEGNPGHPVNRGALCARGQSALQGLYDPDRLRRPLFRPKGGEPQTVKWARAIDEIGSRIKAARGSVHVLSDLQTGALSEVMEGFAAAVGQGPPLLYEPFSYEPLRAAHQAVFGLDAIPDYRLDRCEFVISFGADFLETWVSNVELARRFAEMHACRDGRVGRFVYVGPRLSMTAANADEFLQVPPGAETHVALAMLKAVVELLGEKADEKLRARAKAIPAGIAERAGVAAERIAALAKAFLEAKGSAALACPVAGFGSAAAGAAEAAALLNFAAGRVGQTVDFSRPHALGRTASGKAMGEFLKALPSGGVLIVHNANPAYSRPWAAESIRRAGTVIYLGTMIDETAELADWVLPTDSPLESWGDYEPQAGFHCLMQPTMSRVCDTRSPGDILLALAREADRPLARAGAEKPAADFHGWLRQRWAELGKRLAPSKPVSDFWQESLRAGGVWEEPPPVTVQISAAAAGTVAAHEQPATERTGANAADLWVWAPVTLFDGRVANRGWLQETPEPVSYVVWGTWVDVHPKQAAALGLSPGDVVRLTAAAGSVEAPVRVTGDVAENTVAIPLGQGHTALGRNAKNCGANAFRLLATPPGAQTWAGDGGGHVFGRVTIQRTGKHSDPILLSSGEQTQHGRKILQWAPLSKVRTMKPGEGDKLILPLPEGYGAQDDLYRPHTYKEHRWAMVVDLQRCIGCGACAVACYAENNIYVVGAEQVRRGREMPWLHVVPYRQEGNLRRLGFLPLLCQHCDAAPCEPVCPVFASVHTDEGLNAQVYNRCIGTRYCSNNCPYKVRRFNWLNWEFDEPLNYQLNPEVTVRVRGVMEKCTFCIQRIRRAGSQAKREGRKIRDGEVVPACAQTCPAGVFTFGDLLNPESKVARLTRLDPRRYHLLETLNTKPAVTYLRRVEVDET